VSARRVNGDVEASYGADFRAKCRKLSDRLDADFVSSVIECSDMAKFIERAAFRIIESDRTSNQIVPVSSTVRPGDDPFGEHFGIPMESGG
jgi:hypothetical protein